MRTPAILAPLVFVTVFLLSCTAEKEKQRSAETTTPEALQENKSMSLKNRSNDDLVQSLYTEVVEKSSELKTLEADIQSFEGSANRALGPFSSYDAKSNSYYASADGYVKSIKDSLLRAKIDTLLQRSTKGYEATKKNWSTLLEQSSTNTATLSDRHTVLKLVLTLPLIEKFQSDHLPDATEFKQQLLAQQALITRIEKAEKAHK